MSDIKFTKTHEWIKQDGELFVVGITDHAQQLLGDIVFIELPTEDEEVSTGEELGVIESVKAASDFYAPISGTVVEVNREVSTDPALINQAPLSTGWLVKIKARDISELEQLLDEAGYNQQIT